MNSTSNLTEAQVGLELSHPSGGNQGPYAQLRIIEAASRLVVLSVDIPPEEFYKLFSNLVDSSTLTARLLKAEVYPRVGQTRHFWTRRIGYGVNEDDAQRWAEHIRSGLDLHTASVDSRQGGLWATWKIWSNNLLPTQLDVITDNINTAPLPESAR